MKGSGDNMVEVCSDGVKIGIDGMEGSLDVSVCRKERSWAIEGW